MRVRQHLYMSDASAQKKTQIQLASFYTVSPQHTSVDPKICDDHPLAWPSSLVQQRIALRPASTVPAMESAPNPTIGTTNRRKTSHV
jgi:hypothetical protein